MPVFEISLVWSETYLSFLFLDIDNEDDSDDDFDDDYVRKIQKGLWSDIDLASIPPFIFFFLKTFPGWS